MAVTKLNIPRKGDCGRDKIRWESWESAEKHRLQLEHQDQTLGKPSDKQGNLNVYFCDQCICWHVGNSMYVARLTSLKEKIHSSR